MIELGKIQSPIVQLREVTSQIPQATPFKEAAPAPKPEDIYQLCTPAYSGPYASFLEKHKEDRATIKDFWERRQAWLVHAQESGHFSGAATIGMAQFQDLMKRLIDVTNQIEKSELSRLKRSEEWQAPEMVAAFDEQLTEFAEFSIMLDTLATAAQMQREHIAQHETLNTSTLLAERVLDDFFTGIAATLNSNPVVSDQGKPIIEETMRHAQLLAQHERVVFKYEAAVSKLKRFTSPLVGGDVPWRGHYDAEYPGATDFNPSKLPHNHLNAMHLQKVYQKAQRPAEWDDAFRALNHYPVSVEHHIGEWMANAMWDSFENKFVRLDEDPWEALEASTARRSKVLPTIEAMIAASKAFTSKDGPGLDVAIKNLEAGIKDARKLVAAMDSVWKGNLLIPTLQEYRNLLKPVFAHLDRAEAAIILAAGNFRSGDEARALNAFQKAQGAFVLAVETPYFNSLREISGDYQSLSLYTQLSVLVVSTVVSGGVAGLAAAGTRGAMVGYGASASSALVRGSALFANALTFSVTSAALNYVLVDEPLPKGVSGWTYEIASMTLLFGTLGKIEQRVARPLGAWASGKIAGKMGPAAVSKWLEWVPRWGSEVAEFAPTYAFFAAAWSPLDRIGQQFMNDATFTPGQALRSAYSLESFQKQAIFLWSLRRGNDIAYELPAKMISQKLDVLHTELRGAREAIDDYRLRWAAGPADAVVDGASLFNKAADVTGQLARVYKAAEFLSYLGIFDSRVSQSRAVMQSLSRGYAEGAQEFQTMATATLAFRQANVQPLAPGLVGYEPEAQGILSSVSGLKSTQFAMRHVGNGVFVMEWTGQYGRTIDVTLVPRPDGPLSTSTDICRPEPAR